MNHKILDILEYQEISSRLAEQAVTAPAKSKALNLQPASDRETVSRALRETKALVDLDRIKGQLPLTDFQDVAPSLKRLKVKADLNALELGNILLIFTLAQESSRFVEDAEENETLDLSAIETLLEDLELPDDLYRRLRTSLTYDGEVLDTASADLARLRHGRLATEAEIKEKMIAYTKGKNGQYLSEQIVTIRDDRYVIPVKQEYRYKFGGVVHDQSASGQTLFVEPAAILPLNNRLQNLLAEERQEIHRVLHELSLDAREEMETIKRVAAALSELDFLQAKAKLAKQMRASQPALSADQSFKLLGARHPLIDPDKVVANDIALGQDFDTILITGPNTGGKTITLKTAGLLQLMAQSGLFIPANEGSSVAVFDQIFADIGDEQSIEQSLSTFSSHINDIVAIMKRVSDQSLVLIDEIGAGTDPEEGASLAISILDFFRKKGAKIIVTTHYPELKLYGYNRERTTNASMEFDIKTLSPTYRLQMGIPGHSNAFAIARRLGMREDVVVGAEKLMSSDDSDINHMIDELNKQTKLATENKQKLQTSLDRAKQLEKKLQDALDIYNQRVQKQLDFALDRANEIVAKKRKKADKIIAELEEARKEGMQVKTNQLMDAKGEFNQLAKQEANLAKNKVLQKEKKRHHVQVGDKVKVLSYGQTGTVTKQLGEHDYEVSLGRIKLKVTDRDIDKLAAGQKQQAQRRATSSSRSSRARSSLDLRGQRYEEAMVNLDRYFDTILLSGLSTVTIIHGIGTGAIRQGVQQYLKRNKHVKTYSYAPANEGGTGATIVTLK
ncbi:endonuclease MutS2 [Lactobacillus delbrueckii subsp. bulgaricus]|uniref:endonuclease MutS2 n=1 Tax=Lactobacillus delbrueckii TaxID=1584 RepID=UPI00159477F1|nr:endonuclease MutS2 [Lactobacillus delbrueckii]NVH29350.1 endonuclease MutS2 [Lactobacillus delbrueckii subsp. bulgaricus]NWO30915.1 endonuclease MutS2 [Lactobacillus delbrueckii subsp. bulgaricus]